MARAQVRQKDIPSPSGKQSLRLWLRLLKTSRGIETILRDRLRREFGETLPRFDVLAALARTTNGMTMTALSRHLMVSNGNITGLIDRLSEDGLVRRVVVANDRRAFLIELTPKGRTRFTTLAAAHEVWVVDVLASATRDDTNVMIDLLDKIASRP
jgi:DNA-binding MarR family transcriptional regulator